MLNIGCHLSPSKGLLAMGKTALSIGANTLQFFTRNPRGSKAKPIDPSDAAALRKLIKDNDFAPILAHGAYTLNPCAADAYKREFALMTIKDDLERMEYLPGNMYNFHPGSHVGQGVNTAIDLIAELLNTVVSPKQNTLVLLETMAGKGTEVGGRFEELHEIIDSTANPELIGVCFDTCHVFDAGYDIVNDLDGVLTEFDNRIGLSKLKAIHINDSMNTLGSHKDRHQKIGQGNIGLEAFSRIVNHPVLKNLPFYLETPNELDGYRKEIEILRGLSK